MRARATFSGSNTNGIDPGVSSFLDLSRLAAALAVALSHMLPNLFQVDVVPGHDAVIVFFVISGYVIAFAADERDRTFGRFALNRLARLWSVLLPSLVLSGVVLAWVGTGSTLQFAPPIVQPAAFADAVVRNALFLSQSWTLSVAAPFNDPAWSLSYEAWYYAIFAAWSFAPGRWRWRLTIGATLLAGPPIVALMPAWLLGVWLYRRGRTVRMAPALAYGLFAGCALAYAAMYWLDAGWWTRHWLMELTSGHAFRLRTSTKFPSDLFNACLFAGAILAVGSMPAVNRALARIRGMARTASSKTFSIYLYHMPLLILLHDGLGWGGGTTAGSLACMAIDLALCVLLGLVTEARLPAWRRGLAAAWATLARRPQAALP